MGRIFVAVTVGLGLFVTGAWAQHEEHHPDQAVPPAGKTETGKTGGMMSGGMMMGQTETGKLVEQLLKSFAAIEAEKNPVALKEKLAEHSSLLKELQARVQTQSHMMDMMQRMMGGSTVGEGHHK